MFIKQYLSVNEECQLDFSESWLNASVGSCQTQSDLATKWAVAYYRRLFMTKPSDWLGKDKHRSSLTHSLTHSASSSFGRPCGGLEVWKEAPLTGQASTKVLARMLLVPFLCLLLLSVSL